MKTYRVGTWTFGIVLIAIGIAGIFSIFKGEESFWLLALWWPLMFILLGGEILLFLYRKTKEGASFSYDLFSLFIVGCFAFFGLLLFSLTQTGIIQEVKAVVSGQRDVVHLKDYEESVEGIERIVLYTRERVKIETTTENNISIFGSAQTINKSSFVQSLEKNDYVKMKKAGTTLFVHINELPTHPFYHEPNESTIIALLPANVPVTVNSEYDSLEVAFNEPTNQWSIEAANSLTIHARHQQGVIDASLYSEELNGNATWETIETTEQGTHGTIRLGAGDAIVKVNNVVDLSVFVD